MRRGEGEPVYVGMIGCGVVGSEVAESFAQGRFAPDNIVLKTVAVKNLSQPRDIQLPDSTVLTDDVNSLISDPKIDIVVEVMGGVDLAKDYIFQVLRIGKHVVTANKAVLGEHLPDLFDLARENRVSLSFEAAVCGAIPIVEPLRNYYLPQMVKSVRGIMNGTTNYVLTREAEGLDPDAALKEAQSKGYAESDPTRDLDGSDAADKLALVASIVSGTHIKPTSIFRQGITGIIPDDMFFADRLGTESGGKGYAVKLLASAEQHDGKWSVQVAPALISKTHPLASINGATNAVTVESDLSGSITFIGPGAGGVATSGAVAADILHAAEHVRYGIPDTLPRLSQYPSLVDPEEIISRGYIRTELLDKEGTFARVGRILAECGLSMQSILQREDARDINGKLYTKDIITLHPASQGRIDKALARLAKSRKVHGKPFYMRFAA